MSNESDQPSPGQPHAAAPSEQASEALDAQFDGEEGELLAEVDGELDEIPVEDESGELVGVEGGAEEQPAAFDFSPSPASPRPRTAVKPQVKPDQTLKAVAVPILGTVGVLLLWPAFWSLLLLLNIIESHRESARTMAFVMLMCWPIAGVLLAGAVFFFRQIQREKAALLPPPEASPQANSPSATPPANKT